MRTPIAVSLIVLTLAGCAAPQPAPPVRPAPIVAPPPRPTPAPPPLASDWNDWPFTPGTWSYLGPRSEPRASFGTDQSLVHVQCDKGQRRVGLIVVVGASSGMTIRTTTLTRELPVRPAFGQPAAETTTVSAELSATDPLLDAIAFSRGRFVIEQAGRPPLVLPPHAEIGRVIEDCRG